MRNSSKGNSTNKTTTTTGSDKKITTINRPNSGAKPKPLTTSQDKIKSKVTTNLNGANNLKTTGPTKVVSNIPKPPTQKPQYISNQKYGKKNQ